jgi:hypothetical protein
MLSAAVARTTFRPPRSYTTLWDVTVNESLIAFPIERCCLSLVRGRKRHVDHVEPFQAFSARPQRSA